MGQIDTICLLTWFTKKNTHYFFNIIAQSIQPESMENFRSTLRGILQSNYPLLFTSFKKKQDCELVPYLNYMTMKCLIMYSLKRIILTFLLYFSESWLYWAISNLPIIVHVFLHRYWGPRRFLLVALSISKPWPSVFACLFLQLWGQQLSLCPHLSCRSKKSCFFSLFRFLFVVRT